MNSHQSLKFLDFKSEKNPLIENKYQPQQVKYLIGYLRGLDVKTILIEPNYFDRDYLSEFSSFYSTSVYGYKNTCQRVHFFSSTINRSIFEQATGGEKSIIQQLNKNYLGFCVLRPIQTCLGKTVLKWYNNQEPYSQRVTVKRKYTCHIAGVELIIEGLAWQQQDTGVGACATIALWSALQSSAFDDFHAIPTTAQITKSANITTSFGSRVFPSKGLHNFQLYEAIKELGLSPMVQTGDVVSNKQQVYFTKDRLMNAVASYIRSGYPVIILGDLKINNHIHGNHAVCAVGFRDSIAHDLSSLNTTTLEDSLNKILYIHDDNIGLNARFAINTGKEGNYAVLNLKPPSYSSFKEISNYQIIPHSLVVATHNELRASPNQLYQRGLKDIDFFDNYFKQTSIKLFLGIRFIKLTDYVHNELERLLEKSNQLSQVRLKLWEKLRPLSSHLGLVRIRLMQSMPLLDILYDTTDSNLQRFGYISYNSKFDEIIEQSPFNFGKKIQILLK